jgi:sugar lactone lactonase YvrE
VIVNDLSRPNGIAFSPDQKVLYVANPALDDLRIMQLVQGGVHTDELQRMIASATSPHSIGISEVFSNPTGVTK